MTQPKTLILFFTKSVSLKLWEHQGLLDREKQIYEALLNNQCIDECYWVSYGPHDGPLFDQLKREGRLHPQLYLLKMPAFFQFPLGHWLYSLLCPLIHFNTLKKACLFKTNQLNGGWTALIAKFLFKKPVYLRMGYLFSQLEKQINPSNRLKNHIISCIEAGSYRYANHISVPSQHNYDYITDKKPDLGSKISLFPTYIDTDLFTPQTDIVRQSRLFFVGRLSPVKNLPALFYALKDMNLPLDIYGDGEEKETLTALAKGLNLSVTFFDPVPNRHLPEIMNQYRSYILPSLFEGTPKSLLEAMACGLLCIGTDVTGINSIIKDDYNGILAKSTSLDDIKQAIERAIQTTHYDRLTEHAVQTIQDRYSLAHYWKKEHQLIQALTQDQV